MATIGVPPSLENHKAIAFLIKTGLDQMENYKATKPAFNVWSAKHHLNGVWLAGQLLLAFSDI